MALNLRGNKGSKLTITEMDNNLLYLESLTVPLYRIYAGFLTQSSTSAPTSVELENTLGCIITFTRSEKGTYTINSNADIFNDTTGILFGNRTKYAAHIWVDTGNFSKQSVIFKTSLVSNHELDDGLLTNTWLEIKVYPTK